VNTESESSRQAEPLPLDVSSTTRPDPANLTCVEPE
jgi:hypothetical protein